MRRSLIRLANPVSHATAIPRATPLESNSNSTTQKATSNQSQQTNPRSRLTNTQKSPPLSLEHFLLRSRVLNLYRTILRAIYRVPDPNARRDSVAHAKNEFARNKDVRDTAQIRYLVSTGKAEWDGMRRYIDELALRRG